MASVAEGKIKAEGTRRELVSMVGQKDRIRVDGGGDIDGAVDRVREIDGVTDVSRSDGGLDVLAVNASGILPEILSSVTAAGASISGVEVEEPNLEAVFLHLTGKALRD